MARDPVDYPDPIGSIERPGYDETRLGWVEWVFDVGLYLLAEAAYAVAAAVRAGFQILTR